MQTRSIAVVAVFSAAIIGSDFALASVPNVKLLDTLVFVASFAFGLGTGAAVAVVSETVWSVVSPWGVAGAIAPFLVLGELLFALAGWGASKAWRRGTRVVSPVSLFIAATMAICAFVWDLETNAATALLEYWPKLTMQKLVATEIFGATFAVSHELSDFVLGLTLIPVVIALLPRIRGRPT